MSVIVVGDMAHANFCGCRHGQCQFLWLRAWPVSVLVVEGMARVSSFHCPVLTARDFIILTRVLVR